MSSTLTGIHGPGVLQCTATLSVLAPALARKVVAKMSTYSDLSEFISIL
jgi:hypothetical protein